jgi:hypothetical protein
MYLPTSHGNPANIFKTERKIEGILTKRKGNVS